MATGTHILDYAWRNSAKLPALVWQSLVTPPFVIVIPALMCTCGHLSYHALAITFPCAAMAWWGLARRSLLPMRVVSALIALAMSYLLAKNLLDVGWVGHDPLFR